MRGRQTSTTSAAAREHGHLFKLRRNLRLRLTQDPDQLPGLLRVVSREVRVRGPFHSGALSFGLSSLKSNKEYKETNPGTTDPMDIVFTVVREIIVLSSSVSMKK